MNQTSIDKIISSLFADPFEAVISSPSRQETLKKVRIRPIQLKNTLHYQIEEFTKTQVFHKNILPKELPDFLVSYLDGRFSRAFLRSDCEESQILVSKKGTVTVLKKRVADKAGSKEFPVLFPSHNRTRNYLLPEGTPIPFLVALGVMSKEGCVLRAKYDKFRQINRFLEFVQDVLPSLPANRTITVLDFGCGKSYLTFALYHFLKFTVGRDVRIIGLDLKKDVIEHCNQLAKQLDYTELTFLQGDIADYNGMSRVDMVVTLHACDTATDYALYKAIGWNASVILSVPCCQHELNHQINCQELSLLFRYGLIKERTASLFTDALRANILEAAGYQTQILEFIDLEHTPKNILLRAVRGQQPSKEELASRLHRLTPLLQFLQADPTLYRLLSDVRR